MLSVAFSYPDSMRGILNGRVMPGLPSYGGEFVDYAAALDAATKVADSVGMPIQVSTCGVVRTVYPKGLRDMGY